MPSWIESLTFAKAVYVLIICVAVFALLRELYGVLWSDTLYVGNFDYFADGKSSSEQSKSFPSFVLGQHQLLRSALIEENQRRERADQSSGVKYHRYLPANLPEASRWTSILNDADLKIQGFDLGKILSSLRAWVSPPSQITGFVEKSEKAVRVAINYPSRKLADGQRTPAGPFETGTLNGDSSAALAIAASIVWTQAAESDQNFLKIPRDVFVSWILVWWDYRLLRGKTDTNQMWTSDDKGRWKQARNLVDSLAANGTYAEAWRLRADLIESIPESLKNDADLRTPQQLAGDMKLVQDDRRRYAEADGIATAVAAIQEIAKARLKIVPVLLPASQFEEVSESVKSVLADTNTVLPGRPIWFHSSRSGFDGTLTATAVLDDNGAGKLLLPDYVFGAATAEDEELEFRLSSSGPIIGRARKADLLFADAQKSGGVLLVKLDENVGIRNGIALPKETPAALTGIRQLPAPGTTLQVVTSRGQSQIVLKRQDGAFAVAEKATAPGDGGAPVITGDRALVAMAYSSSADESKLLSLGWLLDNKPGLKLAVDRAAR
jgi:hypothetical protein